MKNKMYKAERLVIREIAFNTTDYQAELILRDKILRQPLGMSLFDENLTRDKYDIHIAAFYEKRLIGVALLTPLSSSELKMRQVAIDSDFQSLKIGSSIVDYCEQYALKNNYNKLVLNARENALEFYKKNKYEVFGSEFLEVGIAHFKMYKRL